MVIWVDEYKIPYKYLSQILTISLFTGLTQQVVKGRGALSLVKGRVALPPFKKLNFKIKQLISMTTDTRETETKYYKFLQSDLCHNGYTYHLGLNIDPMSFNPSGYCQPGGFYLTTLEHLLHYYEYGPYLGIVSLPHDRDAQIYHEEDRIKVDQLILEKIVTGEDDLLEIFRNIRKKYDSQTMPSKMCQIAAGYGHLEVLKWAWENGCEWNERTCMHAAMNGHLEMLKWARENGCPWDESTCAYAAMYNHLDVLKWARENGCPWDSYTCRYAALYDHLDVLKWAQQNGCPS